MSARRTLIVYESLGHWGVALRQAIARKACRRATGPLAEPAAGIAGEFRLRETRSAQDCRAELVRTPQALVAVELTPATCDEGLALVREISERFPAARIVVLAARELESHQWLARELGAVHVVHSPRRLDDVVDLAERYWDSLPALDRGAVENIWSSLPWG